jgi:ubiquinone biosynthesis protein COQ4
MTLEAALAAPAVSAKRNGQSTKVPSVLSRARTATRALYTLSRDSKRLDQVLALNMSVNIGLARRGVADLSQEEEGQALFRDRPRIDGTTVDLDAFEKLPDGTLGREYARFMRKHGITPDAFCEMPDFGDETAGYLVMRMRQTHDLWHVLAGYAPDVEGEVLLQAFTFGQTNAPSAALISTLGTIRHFVRTPGHMAKLQRAYERGKATKRLAAFRWENYWARPLEEVRALLDCPPN